MEQKTEKPVGPIRKALRNQGHGEAEHALTPDELLGSLLDIRGSVELEEFLAGEVSVLSPVQSVPREAILAQAARGLEDVRARLEHACEHAFRPRYRLPTASRAWNILERTGALDARKKNDPKAFKKSFKSAARLMWAPFGEFLETHLKRARFGLQELRDELGPQVAGLGEGCADLERLDRVLRQAIESDVRALYQRVNRFQETQFAEMLKKAIDELPDIAKPDGFELGFSETGWLGGVFGHGLTLIKAITEHEIRQLDNFVKSATQMGPRDSPKK